MFLTGYAARGQDVVLPSMWRFELSDSRIGQNDMFDSKAVDGPYGIGCLYENV
jgi:hypothetical protein